MFECRCVGLCVSLYLRKLLLVCVCKSSFRATQVEMQLSSEPKEDEKVSYVIFALITTLLIATHMFSLLISTCILPSLEVATAGSSGVPRELRRYA